ncbi:MAG: hypothetical protein JXR10_02595 [Cyclobacteriaceae bacterium]
MNKRITFLVLLVNSVVPLNAQLACDGKLNKEHWYYRELQKGEFRENMTLISAQPNSIFPDTLNMQFSSPDELEGLDEHEIMNKLILKEYACFLEMIDEQPLHLDSIESIRLIKNHSVYRVKYQDNRCYLSFKEFDGLEMTEHCKEILPIDFEYLKKRIHQVNFFTTPAFPSPDFETYGLVMHGSYILVEANINGKYHLVYMNNLFTYQPDFNRINLWFMGNARNYTTSNSR